MNRNLSGQASCRKKHSGIVVICYVCISCSDWFLLLGQLMYLLRLI